MRWFLTSLTAALLGLASPGFALDREAMEETVGPSYFYLAGPEDDVYGVGYAHDTQLRDAPLLGEYFTSFFAHGEEDAIYLNAGMTIRLMPKWRIAPFAGGGGSYNYAVARDTDRRLVLDDGRTVYDRGLSFWAGHAEAGVRFAAEGRWRHLEFLARYTWPDLEGNREFWYAAFATGWSF